MVSLLQQTYGIEAEVAKRDVASFVASLKEQDMLEEDS